MDCFSLEEEDIHEGLSFSVGEDEGSNHELDTVFEEEVQTNRADNKMVGIVFVIINYCQV